MIDFKNIFKNNIGIIILGMAMLFGLPLKGQEILDTFTIRHQPCKVKKVKFRYQKQTSQDTCRLLLHWPVFKGCSSKKVDKALNRFLRKKLKDEFVKGHGNKGFCPKTPVHYSSDFSIRHFRNGLLSVKIKNCEWRSKSSESSEKKESCYVLGFNYDLDKNKVVQFKDYFKSAKKEALLRKVNEGSNKLKSGRLGLNNFILGRNQVVFYPYEEKGEFKVINTHKAFHPNELMGFIRETYQMP